MERARIEKNIHAEFKRWSKQPRVEREMELVWVLSGRNITWNGSAASNDTRRRMEEGFRIAAKIGRLNHGAFPRIYISGYDEHNKLFKRLRAEGFFENKYGYPDRRLMVGPLEHIAHTGDQFRLFPKKFLKQFKKIVIVTDTYHIPRVARYVEQYFPENEHQFVFYPALPITTTARKQSEEVKKIVKYAGRGIMPLFTRDGGFRKAAITGGSGFIGSAVAAAFERIPDIWTVQVTRDDYRDRKRLEEKIRGADFVFHFAGVHTGDKTDYGFNIRSTKMLLEALRRHASRALFVFASSFAVYRVPKRGEIVDERFPCKPRNNYGASKLAAERVIRAYAKRYGVRSAVLRISNVYGQKKNPSGSFIDSAVDSLREKSIFKVRVSDEETRDFIHVDDVVRACVALTKSNRTVRGSQIYTICSGEETSIADLLSLMKRSAKGRLRVSMPAEPIAPEAFWKGSFQKARKGLQWHPTIRLKQGLARLIG